MAIQGMKTETLDTLRGGRATARNLSKMIPEFALVATDIAFLGDAVARKRAGYSKVGTYSGGAAVHRLFDYQRQSDKVQFLVGNQGTNLVFSNNTSLGSQNILSSSESSTSFFSFATSAFGLYASNGINSYAEYNTGGSTESLYTPIQAPSTAPTITLGAGSLTLTYGRSYAFCDVSKWTDNQGNSRYHIGPPSPISANTGPITSETVTVGGLTVSTNPRVTHKWIFSTTDVAAGQAADFIFCGEVTNAVTTFGDSSTVLQLDNTRSMPIDNLPWVGAQKLVEYQGRIALLGIPSDPASIYMTGLAEIQLGIPQETIPVEARFTVPGKSKQITGGAQFQQTLMVCTPAMWFQIQGYDINTFQKADDIIEPGACGFEAVTIVQGMLVYMGPDKKLYGWDGANPVVDLSQKLQTPLPGSLSMNDISDAQMPNIVVRSMNFGLNHFIMVGISTDGSAGFNWIQAWDASNLIVASGYAQYLTDGTNVGLAESDHFYTHRMTALEPVFVGNTKYMFMGDANGNVYQYPSGTTDAGSTATITHIAIASNVVTVTCSNTMSVGQKVSLNGLTTATFLNRQVVTIATRSSSQFTASFTHANYTSAVDTGKAVANPIQAHWGSTWRDYTLEGVIKKMLWADLTTDRTDATTSFAINAVCTDGTDMSITPTVVPTQAKPASYGVDPTMVRGALNFQAGTAMGVYTRVVIDFPNDDVDAGLQKVELSCIPLAQTEP